MYRRHSVGLHPASWRRLVVHALPEEAKALSHADDLADELSRGRQPRMEMICEKQSEQLSLTQNVHDPCIGPQTGGRL